MRWDIAQFAGQLRRLLASCGALLLCACATPIDSVLSESGAPDAKAGGLFEASAAPSVLSVGPGPRHRDLLYVGTFNIQNFGKAKAQRPEIMTRLAEIVRRHDVIAIQEISDVSQQAPTKLLEYVNRSGAKYQYVLSERSGRAPDDKPSQEQYAIFFDTQSVQIIDDLGLFEDTRDAFQREPQVVAFKTLASSFKFAVINIHTRPESAVTEIGALKQVATWAEKKLGSMPLMMVGDFNGGCSYATPVQLDRLDVRGPKYHWVVPDTSDSNLSTKQCAYDRIVLTDAAHYSGSWGVWRAFKSSEISDHWPVWASFKLDD